MFKKINWSNLLLMVFLLALLIPQTSVPIKVVASKVKMLLWKPSVETKSKVIAPLEYTLIDMSGIKQSIPIAKGKPVFVSYWATWCPPCIAEMPSIERLYNKYGDKINFMLISNEKASKIQDFLKRKELDIPVFNSSMETPALLKSNSIPASYLIDANGKLLIAEKGAIDWNGDTVLEVVDKMLNEGVYK